jgi:hypothetical protein
MAVTLLNTLVLGVAIVWVIWILLDTRRRLRTGGVVLPPMFASTVLFALGIGVVLALGALPLHLLWWFPVTFVLGVVVLMFPTGVHLTMTGLALLAEPKSHHDA